MSQLVKHALVVLAAGNPESIKGDGNGSWRSARIRLPGT